MTSLDPIRADEDLARKLQAVEDAASTTSCPVHMRSEARVPQRDVRKRQRAVGKICRPDGSTGTGFLAKLQGSPLADGMKYPIVMTNWHVLKTEKDAFGGTMIFDFDGSAGSKRVDLDPHTYFQSNAELDVAVVALAHTLPDEFEPVPITDAEPPPVGEVVQFWGHSGGAEMHQSIGKVTRPHEHYTLWHDASSAGGSSGSVLFDRKLVAIGLHKWGSHDANGATLMRSIFRFLHGKKFSG